MASLEELRTTRLHKLELLKKAGMNPFPSKVPRTFCLGDAKKQFADYEKSGKEVSVAGRIMAIRGQGAILFVVLYDGKGKFQAVFKKDEREPLPWQSNSQLPLPNEKKLVRLIHKRNFGGKSFNRCVAFGNRIDSKFVFPAKKDRRNKPPTVWRRQHHPSTTCTLMRETPAGTVELVGCLATNVTGSLNANGVHLKWVPSGI
jgi:hypothetical protein